MFRLSCYNEDKLKAEGKYEEHYNKIKNKIIDSRIEDFKHYVKEKYPKVMIHLYQKMVILENWVGKIDEERVNEFTKM